MTTSAPTTAARRGPAGIVAITAATVLVVVAALVIVLLGRAPLPGWKALADAPDARIEGMVAFLTLERDQPCVGVVPAGGGAVQVLACDATGFEDVAWTAEGKVVAVSYGAPSGATVLVLDPTSGAVLARSFVSDLETGGWARERVLGPEGAFVTVGPWAADRASIAVQGRDGSIRTVVEAEGPTDYRFTAAVWSPDGRWILASDSAGRLAVVPADGAAEPRLLVESGREAWAGSQLAWHVAGDPTYTVEAPGGD